MGRKPEHVQMCFLFLKTILCILPRNRYISPLLLRLPLLHVAFTSPAARQLLGARYPWGIGPRTPCRYQTPPSLLYKRHRTVGPLYLRFGIHRQECHLFSLRVLRVASVYAMHIPDTLFTQTSPVLSTCHSRLSTVWSKLTILLLFLITSLHMP